MITAYFGLPGVGKTTFLAALAKKECVRIKKHKSKYKHILCNIPLNSLPVDLIEFKMLGRYDFNDCLILIDEASIYCDSRAYNDTKRYFLDWIALHRHYNCDLVFFLQTVNGYDKRLRNLTTALYQVRKSIIPFCSYNVRIPYAVCFPQGDNLGDIVEGYKKPTILNILFAKHFFRPRYYRYFDTNQKPLSLLPYKYKY